MQNTVQNVLETCSFPVEYSNGHRTWKSNMDEPIFFFFIYEYSWIPVFFPFSIKVLSLFLNRSKNTGAQNDNQ